MSMIPLPRLLLVTHALGGGVDRHVTDIEALLRVRAEVDILSPVGTGRVRLVNRQHSNVSILLSEPLERLVEVLAGRHYQRLHIHHVNGFSPMVLELPALLNLPYDLTLHDFYPYCPIYSLATVAGRWCGEPDRDACAICVEDRPNAWGWSIDEWRHRMGQFLAGADRVIVPSTFVGQRITERFPRAKVLVRPHPPRSEWLASSPSPIKVLLLGGLSRSKGLEIVAACALHAKLHAYPLAFCVLGYTEDVLPAWPDLPMEVRGEYDDAQLPLRVALERADVLWFPGQIPETYSYTLDVALNSGLPIVASDLGAISERLSGRDGATLVRYDASAEEWVDSLLGTPARHSPPVQDSNPDGLRDAYRGFLLAPIVASPHGECGTFPIGIPDTAIPIRELPLEVLWKHGIECGHQESRDALRRKLGEISKDYGVLETYERHFGKPWFAILDEGERDHAAAIKEIGQLGEQLLGLSSEAVELNSEVLQLNSVVTQLNTEVTQLNSEADELNSELAELNSDLAKLRRQKEGASRQLHQVELRNTISVAHIASLEADLTRANQRIHELEISHSWMITAPLRLAGTVLRSLRHRIHHVEHHLQWGMKRIPAASRILRQEGPLALLMRIRHKLAAPSFQPDNPFVTRIEAISELQLHTCAEGLVPLVSIVIPAYGQHEYTFNCLSSIGKNTALARVEIIVVDDASPTSVRGALSGIHGVRFLRNAENVGFIESCHRGVADARGIYVLLLNNDVQVTEGWLEALLQVFSTRPEAGLVGSRLVYPDGSLQEAGGIVWRDGSAWNWGRGGDPDRPPYAFLRSADYCSGASLLLRRADWFALGGFDRAYKPAYYEDTDLAFQTRRAGQVVYYQPDSRIVHFEGISSGTDETQGIKRHQAINRETFEHRWREILAHHRPNAIEPVREANRGALGNILVVEACMITPDQDSGSVRMLAMLELMVELGCKVSFIADNLEFRQPYVGLLQQSGIEVWHHPYVKSTSQFLMEHGKEFDFIFFCRHYIATPYMAQIRDWAPQARIIFDTVDLHYLREQRLAELECSEQLATVAARTRAQELAVIQGSDITLVVSPVERELLTAEAPGCDVRVLSNIHEPQLRGKSFAERRGLLFVGGFRHPPNVDAVRWFVAEVWPIIHSRAPEIELIIVGSNMPDALRSIDGNGITLAGFVENIDPIIDSARISIAPLRYGAGVKGKINQAMACGLPVVASAVAAEGMGLEHGRELMIADTPEEFAAEVVALYHDETLWQRLVTGGLDNVREHFSRRRARAVLASIFNVPDTSPAEIIDIIIPIHGQESYARACVESVLAAKGNSPFELVIVDDASPEATLRSWLDELAARGSITLLRQPENRGFVAAVNRGMALHVDRDVVLLNSDTLVHGDWLDRLRRASKSRLSVSSVTPFSNNATICSYPDWPHGGALPSGFDAQAMDRLCSRYCAGGTTLLPTAVGFCMFITRISLNEIGFFDEAEFGKGYGEENDFCMRAQAAGFVHVLAADVFVYHAGGVSFSSESDTLKVRAGEVINKLWPGYSEQIADFIRRDPGRTWRNLLDDASIENRTGAI